MKEKKESSVWDYSSRFMMRLRRKVHAVLTLWTPEVGIPTLRKLPYAARMRHTVGTVCYRRARSRYTCDTVYNRQPPEDGIQHLFSNAYWPQHTGVIEIHTRQQLKKIIIVSMKHSEFL